VDDLRGRFFFFEVCKSADFLCTGLGQTRHANYFLVIRERCTAGGCNFDDVGRDKDDMRGGLGQSAASAFQVGNYRLTVYRE
jgi:hypothetical protein